MRKKFLAVVLAAALACNMTGVSAAAQPAVAGISVLKGLFGGDSADEDSDTQSENQKNTRRSQVYSAESTPKADSVVLDIGRGDIQINGKEISAYDTEGNLVTKTSSQYIVTGSTQEHSIEIASGTNANIVLSNVDITRTEAGESPIWIADDSKGDVSLTLEGVNTLTAGEGAAAIQKNGTYSGSVDKSGKLKITCGNTSPSHVCDASCGTLIASGGEGAAAIGGASGMGASKINIAGGTITADGGIGGGSGGVGTKVEIAGGVVDAGTIDGRENSNDNVLNGNAILMADSTTGMSLKKGVLYQDGEGTVYGDVQLSQAMVDHLAEEDGTLDVPAKEGATLTIDGETDVSDVNFTEGSEVKVDTSKTPAETPASEAAPTKTPASEDGSVIEEEEQEQMRAGDDDGSVSEPIITTTPSTDYFDTSITVAIKRGSTPVTGGMSITYGERLNIEATVNFYGDTLSNNAVTGQGNEVQVYMQNVNGGDLISIKSESIPAEDVGSTHPVTVNVDVVIDNPAILVSADDYYKFVVRYTGGSNYPPREVTVDAQYPVVKGSLKFESSTIVDAIAGRKIEDIINLASDLQNKPKNSAGEEVSGKWVWASADTAGKTLYPMTSDAVTEYTAKYEYDDPREKEKYLGDDGDGNCVLTVRFDIKVPVVDSVEPTITSEESPQVGYDGLTWYNRKSGDITITVPGYQIFTFESTPVSYNGWAAAEQSELADNFILDKDKDAADGGLRYNKGKYEIYVKQMGADGDIGTIVINDFNVDRDYPFVELNQYRITGETAAFNFRTPDESNTSKGSGVYRYTLLTQPISDTSEYDRDYVANSLTRSTTGDFAISDLNPNTTYNLYLLVEDNAGNEIQYIKRTADGSLFWTEYRDPEYYGYQFTTGNPDLKGEMSLTILDSQENLKVDGSVASGDKLRADVERVSSGAGPLSYEWFRRSDNGTEVKISDAMDSSVYTVRDADIGYVLVCHATAENMSGYLQATTLAKVGLGPCPEEYVPTNGREDLVERTFTFTGHVGTAYEYRINGGEWVDVPASNHSDFVIQVGDTTVLAGNLEVRAKETDTYMASAVLTNTESFISSGELEVTLEGDNYYGGTLTAVVASESINPGLFTYQWSRNGQNIDNVGNTYVVQKADIDQRITVRISITGYTGTDNSVTSEIIGRRPVTPVINVTTKQYDGTTTAEATVTLDGVINNDDVTATVTRASFIDKNAGEDKAVNVGTQLGGNDRGYYVVSQLASNAKGTIQPRILELDMEAQDKVYDGTTDAVVTFSAEALPGDDIQVSGTGQFADKNAGTNKRVTPKEVEVTGRDKDNYTGTGSTSSTTANITAKAIEIESITVADKEYDGTTDAVITATFNGAVDDVNYTYTAAFENPNVGTGKKVSAVITLAGESATNYSLSNGAATATGNIVKAFAPYDETDIPQGLTGIEGKKLSSVYIAKGFTWKDPDTVMKTVGRHTYTAYYNPDPSQYGDREIDLEVLVQCAKHTWGDWTITLEPTKEEMGERQRICSVCGYIEVETIPRAPYIATEDTKVGWNDIIQAINNASSGTEIPVVMNGTETLPASVQEALQGREVSLVLQMGNGITWTIRGEDITGSTLKDINMAISLYTDNIPSDVIDSYVKNKTAIQIHLAYSGEFGFVATLRVPLGDEFAGISSTLYYYNPTRERLEQMDSNKVTDDGIGRYDFTHASDYVVVIDKQPDVQGGDTPSDNGTPGASGTVTPGAQATGGAAGTTGTTGTTTGTTAGTTSANVSLISSNGAKTEDDTPIMVYLFLLSVGAGGIAVSGIYRRKRKTRN